MINILGQIIETGDEAKARHIFDVFDTLLITVSLMLFFRECNSNSISRKHPFFRSMFHSWSNSYSSMLGAKLFRMIFVI